MRRHSNPSAPLASHILREGAALGLREPPSKDWRELVPAAEALLSQLTELRAGLPEPLDLGTGFRARVLRAVSQIPLGETRSYREIAAAIGAPSSARAVANACASNPYALIIPCHRVVRSDGAVGGYRWGVPWKEALLAAERGRTAPQGKGSSSPCNS